MKKFFCVISAVLVVLISTTSFASALTEETITYLAENGVLSGDPDGNLRLGDTITRAETAKVICVSFNIASSSGETFPDVSKDHWASTYIADAKASEIINGYEDGTFRPEDKVSYAEFVKMTVESLGKGDQAKEKGGYPYGYIAVASMLGLTGGIEFEAGGDATREHVGAILYNAMNLSASSKPCIYIMGDSLADTFPEDKYPLQGWGTFLGDYFNDKTEVKNRARNGWTTKRYLMVGENKDFPDKTYWDVIKEELKEGDYLLIGLGINDCSLTNKNRTTEEEYKENLTKFTSEAREKKVNVIFITQTIKGGDYDSELGWEYVLPSDGIPMDDSVPMEKRWTRRAKVLTDIGSELDVPVVQFGKYLSELYESMYQEYMAKNPTASVKDGRNYVRCHFHIYNKNINASVEDGGWGLNLPDRADDSTHTNEKGAKEFAKIISELVSQTVPELAKYVK